MDGCSSQRITGHPGRERRSCPSRLPESDSDPRCLSRDGVGARVIRGVATPAGKQAKGRESEISALKRLTEMFGLPRLNFVAFDRSRVALAFQELRRRPRESLALVSGDSYFGQRVFICSRPEYVCPELVLDRRSTTWEERPRRLLLQPFLCMFPNLGACWHNSGTVPQVHTVYPRNV
jgi:hypothetical protein